MTVIKACRSKVRDCGPNIYLWATSQAKYVAPEPPLQVMQLTPNPVGVPGILSLGARELRFNIDESRDQKHSID